MLMTRLLHHKLSVLLVSVLYWGCALLFVHNFATSRSDNLMTSHEEVVRRDIALVRSNLEARIFENIYKADSLATVISIDPVFALSRWESIAGKLVNQSPYVRNVGAAPDNVIRYVFPLAGNEKALGFDFRTNPKQYASVQRARELGGVYLDGPLELVQGGQALIARFPIFSDFPDKNNYWGSVSIVLNYDQLLKDTGIESVEGADIALQRRFSYTDNPVTFYGDPSVFDQPDLLLPILLPNAHWSLAARFNLTSPHMWTVYALGFGGFALLYASVLMLLRAYRISHNASLQDELTKLPNRRSIMATLEALTDERSGKNFALLNIDLNGFKKVNDEFGHDIGDQLLKHIAQYLRRAVTERDVVARIGGDEFLVVLTYVASDNKAVLQIENIKAHLSQHPFCFRSTQDGTEEEHTLPPSLSIGFALFDPQNPVSIEELLNIADQHMYQHKQESRTQKQASPVRAS